MLQRTRAASVVPVYESMVEAYPTPKVLADAGLERVTTLIYPLGLKWRAKLIHELAISLSARNDIPSDYDELKSLPGVGEYVASAWMSLHADKRAILIDANIVRWLCRMFGQARNGETRREPWVKEIAGLLTPRRSFKRYNYAALDFTMNVCGVRPNCEDCMLARHCTHGKGMTAQTLSKKAH